MRAISSILKTGDYASKMTDPRWIEFTKGVRRRKGNHCASCRRGNVPTSVHHPFYDGDREPWEYSDEEVVVLCWPCHKTLHLELQRFRRYVFAKMSPQVFRVFNGALAVGLDHYDPSVLAHAFAELVSTHGMIERFAKAWTNEAEKRDDLNAQIARGG